MGSIALPDYRLIEFTYGIALRVMVTIPVAAPAGSPRVYVWVNVNGTDLSKQAFPVAGFGDTTNGAVKPVIDPLLARFQLLLEVTIAVNCPVAVVETGLRFGDKVTVLVLNEANARYESTVTFAVTVPVVTAAAIPPSAITQASIKATANVIFFKFYSSYFCLTDILICT